METVMYFPESEYNETDKTLEKFEIQQDALIATYKLEVKDGKFGLHSADQDAVYNFNITLPGKNKFKHY
jgi:protocatechuate 3,4-dioxygenase beta subunit